MADFRLDIGSGVKTLEIYGSDGVLLATKTVNVGNKTELKKWINELSGLETIKSEGIEALDEMEAMEKKIIDATIGDFELFWKASGENPMVLLKTLISLSKWLQGQLEDMYKGMI